MAGAAAHHPHRTGHQSRSVRRRQERPLRPLDRAGHAGRAGDRAVGGGPSQAGRATHQQRRLEALHRRRLPRHQQAPPPPGRRGVGVAQRLRLPAGRRASRVPGGRIAWPPPRPDGHHGVRAGRRHRPGAADHGRRPRSQGRRLRALPRAARRSRGEGAGPGPPRVCHQSRREPAGGSRLRHPGARGESSPVSTRATHVVPPASSRLRWWREVAYILAFYGVYTLVRNLQEADTRRARANALHVIHFEKFLGIYHEHAVQHWFGLVQGVNLHHIAWRTFIQFWNVYYGSAHFIVTIVAIVWLFRRDKARYPLWRNTLAFTTALALIGFAFFPLMPPRLLPASYGFVDTLAKYGGLWSFASGTMKAVSNQYAAMPSLHFAWSTWCVLVLWPATEGRPWATGR